MCRAAYPNIFDPNLAEGVNISTGEALNSAPQGLLPRLMRYTPPGPDNKPKASESQRMGCQKGGPEEIKKHKWFRGLNWAKLYNRQVTPPWRPMLKSEEVLAAEDSIIPMEPSGSPQQGAPSGSPQQGAPTARGEPPAGSPQQGAPAERVAPPMRLTA